MGWRRGNLAPCACPSPGAISGVRGSDGWPLHLGERVDTTFHRLPDASHSDRGACGASGRERHSLRDAAPGIPHALLPSRRGALTRRFRGRRFLLPFRGRHTEDPGSGHRPSATGLIRHGLAAGDPFAFLGARSLRSGALGIRASAASKYRLTYLAPQHTPPLEDRPGPFLAA